MNSIFFMNKQQTNPYFVPVAIVIVGAFIGGAIFFSSDSKSVASNDNIKTPVTQQDKTNFVDPVDDKDHIRGSMNAPVKIVEYSDFECPFCQRHHGTLAQIFNSHVESGDVAWVFRQFPIEQSHSKAPTVALASECVAKLGGNEAFWKFADRYFEVSLSNNRTDIEMVIPKLIGEIGVSDTDFQSCMNSGELMADVEEDFNNAVATGSRGTPWSILIAPNGKTFPINGAQPAAAIEQLIQIALTEV